MSSVVRVDLAPDEIVLSKSSIRFTVPRGVDRSNISRFVAVFVLALHAVNPVSAQEQIGCGTNPFQDWYWRDFDNRPVITITGEIDEQIEHNADNFWDDGDWNIYVDPDANFGWVNTNSDGDTNDNNRIELEIQTSGLPDFIPQRFPTGTRVEARGPWVEDTGHGDKTELHPLYYMRTVDTNPIHVFVGQDNSDRFITADSVRWEHIDVPIVSAPRVVRPTQVPASNTLVVRERGEIARGTTAGSLSENGYFLSVYLPSWVFSDCPTIRPGRVTDGDPPYFFSSIEQSHAPLLEESVTYSVGTDVNTGQKIAGLRAVITLNPPPGITYAFSRWTYESSAGTVIGTAKETLTSTPHRFVLSMPYAPALDLNQFAWRVDVNAASEGFEGPEEPPQFAEQIDRTFVTESRIYTLEPSRLSLDAEKKGSGICGDAVYLSINVSGLLPNIDLRPDSVTWGITRIRDREGMDITNPTEETVPLGQSVDDPGFQAFSYTGSNTNPHGYRRFDVVWKTLPSGLPNLTKLKVRVRAVTELGENVSAAIVLSPACGLGAFSYGEMLQYAYRVLAAKGYKGEIYRYYDKLDKDDRRWLDILGRYIDGRRLKKSETELLIKKAKEGSALPALPEESRKDNPVLPKQQNSG